MKPRHPIVLHKDANQDKCHSELGPTATFSDCHHFYRLGGLLIFQHFLP